jgi:FkbM family methyltransferase
MPTVHDLNQIVGSIWRDESNRQQRLRRVAHFVGWQVWKRSIRTPITLRLPNGFRFVAYPDCGVSAGFIYRNIPDYRDISFLRRHLNGGVLVDVGANVGSVTLQLADRIDHAILFEPNPTAAARAQENLRLNGLSFEVHVAALSDTCQALDVEDLGGVNTCNRTGVGFKSSQPTRKVLGLTFDQFLSERTSSSSRVDWIKIDVEGHENAVLRGMKKLLAVERPRLVMFEYLARTNLSETLGFFQTLNYCVFQLTSQGPSLVTHTAPPLQNLFACPVECSSIFNLPERAA